MVTWIGRGSSLEEKKKNSHQKWIRSMFSYHLGYSFATTWYLRFYLSVSLIYGLCICEWLLGSITLLWKISEITLEVLKQLKELFLQSRLSQTNQQILGSRTMHPFCNGNPTKRNEVQRKLLILWRIRWMSLSLLFPTTVLSSWILQMS